MPHTFRKCSIITRLALEKLEFKFFYVDSVHLFHCKGYTLELSQEAAEREAGIKKTSFHKYVNLMIEKGYLVQRGDGSNLYDFYERPQEKKKKEAKPSGELDSLRAGHDEGNCDSPDELLSLLSEFENSQGDSVSSQRSKEIYNKGDTSQNKKINSDDVCILRSQTAVGAELSGRCAARRPGRNSHLIW